MAHDTPSSLFIAQHTEEAAQLIEQFPIDKITAFLASLPAKKSAALLDILAPTIATSCLSTLPEDKALDAAKSLSIDKLTLLFPQLPAAQQASLLPALPPAKAAQIEASLRYPRNTVGNMMDTTIFSLPIDAPINQIYRQASHFSEQRITWIYLVDRQQVFQGGLHVSQLLTAQRDASVRDLKKDIPARLSPYTPVIQIQHHPAWQHYDVLPIVDQQGVLIGSLSWETVRQFLEATTSPASHWLADNVTAATTLYGDFIMTLLSTTADILSPEKKHAERI